MTLIKKMVNTASVQLLGAVAALAANCGGKRFKPLLLLVPSAENA